MMHPNDDTMIRMAESAWNVVENEEAAVHHKQAMQVVALMRQRLITLSNGSQEEYHLRNIFRTFDANNNGVLSLEELSGLLSKLGVDCQRKELIAVFKLLDGNNNGAIDFEEFNQFVIVDPYK
jgi:Ca2+-binding EF-hand superfamily protein